MAVMVRVGFRRANVEHCFRVAKTELGFTHFEGRNYVALMRHLNLCLSALNFVAEHTERLRGEKSGDDDGASVSGFGTGVSALVGSIAGDERVSPRVGGHCLPPGTQPHRSDIQTEATGRNQDTQAATATATKTSKSINRAFQVAL